MPETVLAFDFGLRRIGVAVGQDVTGSASPLGIVRNDESGVDQDRIAALIAEWQPARLIVGIPLNADGSDTDMAAAVMAFIESLDRYGLPVDTVDERFTSIEAENRLKKARAEGTRGRLTKKDIDSAAAALIAERYLAAKT